MTTDEPSPPTPSNDTSLGGRVRKTTQKFTFVEAETDEFSAPQGSGVKVRDMPFVKSNVEALGKKQQEMIKQLYNIMFGRRFQQKNMKVIKEHILDFSGILEQDEKSRDLLFDKMGRWKRIFVVEVMDLLAVNRSKNSFDGADDKKALITRLIDWLYNPQETKLGEKKAAIAANKDKLKVNKRAKAEAEKKEGDEKEPVKKKRRTTKKKAVAAVEEEEEDHEATESEGEESSSDFKEAKKKPTKKRKATRRPKKSRVVESDNEDDEGEKEEDVAAVENEEQPDAESEAETNVAEKEESKPETEPLAADVCDKVRDIIAQGNAEELTVKKIVRQLSSDLGRDMSSQKKAIKEFITNDQAEI